MTVHKRALLFACLGGYGWRGSTRRLPNIHPAESLESSQVADTSALPLTTFANLILALDPLVALKLSHPRAQLPWCVRRKLAQPLMCAATSSPPVARRVPHKVAFGKVAGENRGPNPMNPPVELEDDYFWLRDDSKQDEEVLRLLREENAYTEACTERLAVFQEKLFAEIVSHIDFTKGDSNSAFKAITGAGAIFALAIVGAYVAASNQIDTTLIVGVFIAVVVSAAAALVPSLATSSTDFDATVDANINSYPMPAEDGYEYWSRSLASLQFVRRPRNPLTYYKTTLRRPEFSEEDEVILDLAQVVRSPFFVKTPGWAEERCSLGAALPCPSGDVLAYSIDGSGSESYNIRFKILASGVDLDEQITGTDGSIVWLNDDLLFYQKRDGTFRSYQVWKHVLGTKQDTDELVYEEKDELFSVYSLRSSDASLMFIGSASAETNEQYFIPISNPSASPTLIRARQFGVRYTVESHAPSRSLYLISNVDGKDTGELFVASFDAPSTWNPVLAAGTQVLASSTSRSLGPILCCEDFLAVGGREDGFSQIWVVPLTTTGAAGDARRLVFDEECIKVSFAGGTLFRSNGKLRVEFTSLTTPKSLLEYDINTNKYETLSDAKVNNYDKKLYKSKRIQVTARDGVAVPVTLFWRPDKVGKAMEKGGGGAPCHLYGYGSYGEPMEPVFNSRLLPLVDRGVVYAIGHVRGGGEMGNYIWHDLSGKYLTKQNTFNDFVDVAQALLEQGIAKPGALSCQGGSAGGLLVGSVVNMAPEIFVAALAQAPFVDFMVSMCDSSLPLMIQHWEEWGNPNEAKYHDYMKSYSPLDNVREGERYPSLLITSGLNDPRVPYWHASKWAQVLRSRIVNGEDVLLKTNLGGHFDLTDTAQGDERSIRSLAFQYAWLLDKLGKADKDGVGDVFFKLSTQRSKWSQNEEF